MSAKLQQLKQNLEQHFVDAELNYNDLCSELTLTVDAKNIYAICEQLKSEPQFHFEQLVDLCGLDYLQYGQADWENSSMATDSGFSRGVEDNVFNQIRESRERFVVVYHLLSIKHNWRLRVKATIDSDPPRLQSVIDIWSGADWFEREAFDLFGILFEGHPDLRRLLTDYGFIGHPFRKDFPLVGEVEMRYDPQKGRVVYEPVTTQPRTLVPRVIRKEL